MASTRQSGGFLLSPPLSTASSRTHSSLPHPRSSPLRPGGSKESTFIRFVDQQLLDIQRRFAKRTTPDTPGINVERDAAAIWDSVQGYTSMREACRDIADLVGTIWISGTPSLQVPYLINVALLLTTIIPAMPPTPKSLFRLLDQLDHAFASLLQGRDIDSGDSLPGFSSGRGVSGTEKVRMRGLAERTRRSVMAALKSADLDFDLDDSDTDALEHSIGQDDGELVLEGDFDMAEDEPDWEMQIARVYDRTILELGDSLEAPNIGIITD